MASSPAVIAEFEARIAREREKALRKYGRGAVLPAGRPEFDVLDFAINETIGLIRYGEMIEARHKMMLQLMDGLSKGTRELLQDGIGLAREMSAAGARYSLDALRIWIKLRKAGLHLGVTEKTA